MTLEEEIPWTTDDAPGFSELERVRLRLLSLPAEIAAARRKHLDAECFLHEAEEALKDREADLVTGGEIDGKNAETRAMQLRQHTLPFRMETERRERQKRSSAIAVDHLRDELYALNAYSRTLSARSE